MTMNSLLLVLLFSSSINVSMSFLSRVSETQFNQTKAKELWIMNAAASCNPDRLAKWDVATIANYFPNIRSVSVFQNITGENLGYTAYNPDTNEIIMSFRGSENTENWIEDIDFLKSDFSKCQGCEVHTGFYDAYDYLKNSILAAFKALVKENPSAKTTVTGHSLGAAMATFAVDDLIDIFGNIDFFYTYGSPRVGNSLFVSYLNQKLNGKFRARITHYKDPVPHLPLDLMGFAHVDNEVYYVEDSSSYIVCKKGQEDPNCANQHEIISFEVSDHDNYIGIVKSELYSKCR